MSEIAKTKRIRTQPKRERDCDWMTDEQLTFWIARLSDHLAQALEEQREREQRRQ